MLEKISDGRTDLVFEYLSNGHAANSTDSRGVSLIKWCAYYGDVSAIRFLLSNGESLDSLGDNFDLNGACYHGHWQLCQFLIERGADVNCPLANTGETPLHAALCKAERPAYNLVVRVLLANGANPNARTKKSVQTGAFMRDCRTKGETPLIVPPPSATRRLSNSCWKRAAIDAKDMNGDSPLTWASWHLRPGSILTKLCYADFHIHPGWVGMESNLRGKPHV